MPKNYAVKPRLQPGRKSYIATFYNSSGNRITRGLETDDYSRAVTICADLVSLWTARIADVVQALALNVEPFCLKLYFGENQNLDQPGTATLTDVGQRIVMQAFAEAQLYPAAMRARLRPILADRLRLKEENEALHVQLGQAQRVGTAEKAAREQIERSVVAQAAKASAMAPALAIAREAYAQHLKATVNKPVDYISALDRFCEYLADRFPAALNVGDVLPGHVTGFLDEKADLGDASKKAIRRRNLRTLVGRFFNWCAEKYQIVSPMSGVKTVAGKAIRRERGDIHWHALADVEAALKQLPERLQAAQGKARAADVAAADVEYWRALIGALAFSGLQLAELCWLRLTDLELSADRTRGKLWVTTVDDPSNAGKRHLLKTDNRRRHVDVHPRHLLPLLLRHVDEKRHGDFFLFPSTSTRKRRGLAAADERWREMTLSTLLRGHVGGKQRKKTPGLLPPGMNAKSLRRTFGSLLIRSGKSTEQVAAAMGNTPAVVREHYGRILGCEVDVDF